MPYRTARRDRMRAAQARATGAAMERDRIGITVEAHEVRVATLGRMVAERDEELADLRRKLADNTEQCTAASARLAQMLADIRRPDLVVDLAGVTVDDAAELAREINAVRRARGAA